jgi:hypothetical protein
MMKKATALCLSRGSVQFMSIAPLLAATMTAFQLAILAIKVYGFFLTRLLRNASLLLFGRITLQYKRFYLITVVKFVSVGLTSILMFLYSTGLLPWSCKPIGPFCHWDGFADL